MPKKKSATTRAIEIAYACENEYELRSIIESLQGIMRARFPTRKTSAGAQPLPLTFADDEPEEANEGS